MKRSELKLKMVVTGLFASVFLLSGCLFIPSGGRRMSLSDRYKSAEEFCSYWYGPCSETDSYESGDSDRIVHEMKDEELGFEYTVEENEGGYFFFSDFTYYYINEFIARTDFKDLISEYDLRIEHNDDDKRSPSRSIKIYTDREITDEKSRKILSDVMDKLDKFDSERNVFNKSGDNKHVALSVWSAPWEKDKSNKARYHVVNDTFGDNP